MTMKITVFNFLILQQFNMFDSLLNVLADFCPFHLKLGCHQWYLQLQSLLLINKKDEGWRKVWTKSISRVFNSCVQWLNKCNKMQKNWICVPPKVVRYWEILRVEGGGDVFPIPSQVLVDYRHHQRNEPGNDERIKFLAKMKKCVVDKSKMSAQPCPSRRRLLHPSSLELSFNLNWWF